MTRGTRQRYAEPAAANEPPAAAADLLHAVEVRDLAVYEQMLEVA